MLGKDCLKKFLFCSMITALLTTEDRTDLCQGQYLSDANKGRAFGQFFEVACSHIGTS